MMAIGLCLTGRYILLADDTTMPIVGMLDSEGEDTDNPALAVVVMFQRKDGLYSGEFVQRFREAELIIDGEMQ